jgi:hypothetical protein
LEVLVSILGIFILPISEHSFILKALNKLYLARTTDKNMFKKPKDKGKKKKGKSYLETPQELRETEIEKEVRMHYPILLSFETSIKLFILNLLRRLKCYWKKEEGEKTLSEKLLSLYD